MTDQEALSAQHRAMIKKGERSLKAAQRHLADGDLDFACSKAYYAAFHLMQAVLLTEGLTYSKHSGVLSGFSQHFIKTGRFPSDFGELIQRLRKDREVGDYGYQMNVPSEDATQDVTNAQSIISKLTDFVKPFIL